MKTYLIISDSVQCEIEGETADAAAVEFARHEKIRGVTDLASLAAAFDRVGGTIAVYDGDSVYDEQIA